VTPDSPRHAGLHRGRRPDVSRKPWIGWHRRGPRTPWTFGPVELRVSKNPSRLFRHAAPRPSKRYRLSLQRRSLASGMSREAYLRRCSRLQNRGRGFEARDWRARFSGQCKVETPRGQANVHLRPADEPNAALVLGHGAAGGVTSGDLVTTTDVARSGGISVALGPGFPAWSRQAPGSQRGRASGSVQRAAGSGCPGRLGRSRRTACHWGDPRDLSRLGGSRFR
jgi:hypothetical protein